MSDSYINQITLECLLNKELMGNHVMKQREKMINREEFVFYRKRIFNLFKEIINGNSPSNMPPDVKYAYDTYVKASIQYFKVADSNDLLQDEYKDIPLEICKEETVENTIQSDTTNLEADKLMMRTIKMDVVPTLDKYVKRKSNKKPDTIILPKQREVNIKHPELMDKGLKKNIDNIYEDIKQQENKKKETQEN